MRKKKKIDKIKDEINKPQWWAKGTDAAGNPITKTISRERLSINAVNALNVFLAKGAVSLETSKTMRDIYDQLHKVSHDFGTSQCSVAIQELQNKGFLYMRRGSQIKKADRTDSVTTTRKARFWLTEKAASKALTVGTKGWVIEDDKYIASDETRAKVKARENAKVVT